MSKCNRCVRTLTIYVSIVAGIACLTTGAAGLMVIEKYQDRQESTLQAVAWEGAPSNWQEQVDAIQVNCGLALDMVAASMADEEFDSVPLEVWESAYQQCLIDNNATI